MFECCERAKWELQPKNLLQVYNKNETQLD